MLGAISYGKKQIGQLKQNSAWPTVNWFQTGCQVPLEELRHAWDLGSVHSELNAKLDSCVCTKPARTAAWRASRSPQKSGLMVL